MRYPPYCYARTSGRLRTRRWLSRSGHRVRVRRGRPAAARRGPGHPDGSQQGVQAVSCHCLIGVGRRTVPSSPKDRRTLMRQDRASPSSHGMTGRSARASLATMARTALPSGCLPSRADTKPWSQGRQQVATSMPVRSGFGCPGRMSRSCWRGELVPLGQPADDLRGGQLVAGRLSVGDGAAEVQAADGGGGEVVGAERAGHLA